MRNEPRAIVIVWQGKELPDDAMAKIVAIMAESRAAIPELVTAKQFDSDGLAKCISSTIHIDNSGILNNSDLDPIHESIVFIGTYYKDCVSNSSTFALRLSSDLADEKYKRATGKPTNDSLLSAVEILATKTITSKYAPLLSEYGMKKSILEVIHATYIYHNNVFLSLW